MKKIMRLFKMTALAITMAVGVNTALSDTADAQMHRVDRADKKVGTVLPAAEANGYLNYHSPAGHVFIGGKTMWDSPFNMIFGFTIVPSDIENNRNADNPPGDRPVIGGLPSVAFVYETPYLQGYFGNTNTAYSPQLTATLDANPYAGLQFSVTADAKYFHNSSFALNRSYGRGDINPNINELDTGITTALGAKTGWKIVNPCHCNDDEINVEVGATLVIDQDNYKQFKSTHYSWTPTAEVSYFNPANGIEFGAKLEPNQFRDETTYSIGRVFKGQAYEVVDNTYNKSHWADGLSAFVRLNL